jgi:hypothetical protein
MPYVIWYLSGSLTRYAELTSCHVLTSKADDYSLRSTRSISTPSISVRITD